MSHQSFNLKKGTYLVTVSVSVLLGKSGGVAEGLVEASILPDSPSPPPPQAPKLLAEFKGRVSGKSPFAYNRRAEIFDMPCDGTLIVYHVAQPEVQFDYSVDIREAQPSRTTWNEPCKWTNPAPPDPLHAAANAAREAKEKWLAAIAHETALRTALHRAGQASHDARDAFMSLTRELGKVAGTHIDESEQ